MILFTSSREYGCEALTPFQLRYSLKVRGKTWTVTSRPVRVRARSDLMNLEDESVIKTCLTFLRSYSFLTKEAHSLHLCTSSRKRYGFASMADFRNWYWNRKFSAGPVLRWGSQQLDVINWFLRSRPKSVFGSAGIEYYDRKTHSVVDTCLGILEYELPSRTVRVFYRVLTWNGNLGDYEKVLGDSGTIVLSQGAGKVQVIKEERVIGWERWVNLGLLKVKRKSTQEGPVQPLRITDTAPPTVYEIPVELKQSPLGLHLKDFFFAIKKNSTPSCSAEIAFEALVVAEKLKEASLKGEKIQLKEEDFSL